MSDSLQPHGLQHDRHPCPSPFSRACSNSYPLKPSSHLILCHPLLLLLQSFPESGSFLMSQPCASGNQKYWSFSFSISPFNVYSGLISLRIDLLYLLAVQETPKSLYQHHGSKASFLLCSAFFMVQLSHPYMTTGKTIALARWTFVSKVTSLLFNTYTKFGIAFLLRSKCLLNSWLRSPFAVILEPKGEKNLSLFPLFPYLFAMK